MSKITIPVCKDDFGRVLGSIAIIGMMTFLAVSSFVLIQVDLFLGIVVTILIGIVEVLFAVLLITVWDKIEWLENKNPFRFKC